MIAFHGDPSLKTGLLAEVAKHRLQDQLIRGTYGRGSNGDWKGCAVACSIHSLNRKLGKKYDTSDHSAFEDAAGVPRQLAYLQDYIFERIQSPKHLDWPEEFWFAIEPGADLSMVAPQFTHWLLTDLLTIVKDERALAILTRVATLYKRWIEGIKPSDAEWNAAAATAATDAATAAATAAYAATDAATAAATAACAAYAATATDAATAAYAAYAAAITKQSEKLIELLRSAPLATINASPREAEADAGGNK